MDQQTSRRKDSRSLSERLILARIALILYIL